MRIISTFIFVLLLFTVGWGEQLEEQVKEESSSPFVFELSYILDALTNVSGGQERGSELLGSALIDLKLDAEDAFGWKGASFEVSALAIHGGNFTDRVGDFQTVSNVEAPQTFSLFRAYYEQKFWQDRMSVMVGLLNVDHEFDTRETAEVFVHSSPGTGGDIGQLGENGPGIFPVGALGARLKYEHEGWYGQAAVIEGIPGDPNDPFGTTLSLDRDEGFFVIGEMGHVWSDESGQLGKVGLGGWGFTEPFATHTNPNAEASNRGAYLSLEKALYREEEDPSQGLAAYLRTGFADGRVNPIETFVGAGLVYTGPFQGRDSDIIGISVNTGFADSSFIQSGPSEPHETALELTYSFAVNDNLSIQPDLQYIINPGFDPNLQNSFIVGLRAVATFSSN